MMWCILFLFSSGRWPFTLMPFRRSFNSISIIALCLPSQYGKSMPHSHAHVNFSLIYFSCIYWCQSWWFSHAVLSLLTYSFGACIHLLAAGFCLFLVDRFL